MQNTGTTTTKKIHKNKRVHPLPQSKRERTLLTYGASLQHPLTQLASENKALLIALLCCLKHEFSENVHIYTQPVHLTDRSWWWLSFIIGVFCFTAPFYSLLSAVMLVILPKMTKQYMLITQSHFVTRYRNDFFKFQL